MTASFLAAWIRFKALTRSTPHTRHGQRHQRRASQGGGSPFGALFGALIVAQTATSTKRGHGVMPPAVDIKHTHQGGEYATHWIERAAAGAAYTPHRRGRHTCDDGQGWTGTRHHR